MKDFILENWHVIADFVLLICVTLITLFKKKVKVFNSIYDEILSILPGLISTVEVPGHGETKLVTVLGLVNNYLLNKYPDFKVGSYDKYIIENIEKILSTPQKKEVSKDER